LSDLFLCFNCAVALLRNIFDEDNYTPMSCQDENEYNAVLKEFPFDDSARAQVLTYPVVVL